VFKAANVVVGALENQRALRTDHGQQTAHIQGAREHRQLAGGIDRPLIAGPIPIQQKNFYLRIFFKII
jgi:hypothetical protein